MPIPAEPRPRIKVTVSHVAPLPHAVGVELVFDPDGQGGYPIKSGHVQMFWFRGATLARVNKALTGREDTSPIGTAAVVEIEYRKADSAWHVCALWDADQRQRIPAEPPPPPTLSELASALKHINAKRVGVQAELEPVGALSWASRANPWATWTADDVISEARRLGWRP